MKKYLDYEYETNNIIIDGESYEGIFPKKHTRLRGLVLKLHNLWAHDAWATNTKYHLSLFVLRKGKNKWQKLYQGLKKDYDKPFDVSGIFPCLFYFEAPEFKKEFLKKAEIEELKKEIKEKNKRLIELLN